MCHETDSLPPLPPIRGGAVDASEVVLTSPDGTNFAGYLARAEAPGGPGIVVIPDVRGLHPFYLELARRLAEAGVHAVALDLYARTAGPGLRGADFEYMPHVNATERATIRADVAAGIAALRDATGGAADRVYVMGFCFGGRAAFAQGVEGHELDGVIGFYGSPTGPARAHLPEPSTHAAEYTCPVLGLFGGADGGIPPESVAAFDEALTGAGVAHRLVTYPGAPHSFFDRTAAEHADAAASAWREVLTFVGISVP